MDKGARVRITGGRQGKGKTGEIFWKGPNKWGEGERFGVRGDDGETYWVADRDVEVCSESAPEPEAGPTFAKGDRVRFQRRGVEGTGTVFWIGESKNGPGQRLGVRDDAADGEDDAVWIDARLCEVLDGDGPPPRSAPARLSQGSHDDEVPPAQSYEMPPLDDGPPLDDAYAESWASAIDEAEEPPFDL